MSLPRTYLLTAPDSKDAFGRGMNAVGMVQQLRKLNPRIQVWEEYPEHVWYPGKDLGGVTCLWLGPPGGKSRKITAFTPGVIPEFTQLGPDGSVVAKGWRAIFERCISAKALSRRQIENAFGVTLDFQGDQKYCISCHRRGRLRDHNGGKRKMCHLCDRAYALAERNR